MALKMKMTENRVGQELKHDVYIKIVKATATVRNGDIRVTYEYLVMAGPEDDRTILKSGKDTAEAGKELLAPLYDKLKTRPEFTDAEDA